MNVKLCYLVTYFFEAVILQQYTSFIFTPKTKRCYNLLTLFSLYLVLFFLSFFGSFWINVIAFFVCSGIYILSMYDTKFIPAFYHSSIATVIIGICELLIFGILSIFFPDFLANTLPYENLMLLAVFSKTLYFFTLYLLAHFVIQKKKYSTYYDRSTILLGLIPISTCIVVLTIIKLSEQGIYSSYLDYLVILSSVLLLTVNLLVFGVHQFNQKKSVEFTELQLLLQKEENTTHYYEMLLQERENQSILIHDIKKHLQSISMLNEEGNTREIASYIEELQLSSGLRENTSLCDNQMLNAILCRYQRECCQKNITFDCDIRSETVNFIAEHDITSIFCNLLDNALDSASSMPDSFIEFRIARKENTPFVVVTMINSCRENPFSSRHQLITRKTDKPMHGFGMKSIHRSIQKYSGEIKTYYHDETLTFHTIITLKNKVA